MKKIVAGTLGALMLGWFPGLALGQDAAAGKAVYGKKCQTCHGADGAGNAAMAKMLQVEIKDLGSAAVQAKTDEQLKKEAVGGVGKMKPVAGLSDADAANLVAYIRSMKK